MRQICLTLLLLAAPSVALGAGRDEPASSVLITAGQLSAVAMNGAESTRTIEFVTNGRWSKLRLGVQYTYSAATSVDAQFDCSFDKTTYYRMTTRSCSSGTCTLYEASDSNPVAATINFMADFDIRGCKKVKIVLSAPSADGSDLITTQSAVTVGL